MNNKSKIALCIANLAAKGWHGAEAYKIGYAHLREKILDKYSNVDVFLHSYEPELQEELLSFYNPQKFHFDTIMDFREEWKDLDQRYDKLIGDDGKIFPPHYPKLFSMMYSRYKVGLLKSEYEKEHNFTYDWVILVRYDIAAPHLVRIHFDARFNRNFLYTCHFNQINIGPQDQWFYSTSEKMNVIFSLYEHLKEYLVTDSEFAMTATTNWIDSNRYGRYTNEFLREITEKADPSGGEQVPPGYVTNTHLLYKWHLYKNNLWNRDSIRFVRTEDPLTTVLSSEPRSSIIDSYNYDIGQYE